MVAAVYHDTINRNTRVCVQRRIVRIPSLSWFITIFVFACGKKKTRKHILRLYFFVCNAVICMDIFMYIMVLFKLRHKISYFHVVPSSLVYTTWSLQSILNSLVTEWLCSADRHSSFVSPPCSFERGQWTIQHLGIPLTKQQMSWNGDILSIQPIDFTKDK
jgi:hypothetical protein